MGNQILLLLSTVGGVQKGTAVITNAKCKWCEITPIKAPYYINTDISRSSALVLYFFSMYTHLQSIPIRVPCPGHVERVT